MPRKTKEKAKEKKVETKKRTEKRNGSWFKTGEEGVKEKKQLDAVTQFKRDRQVQRFRLRPNEEAKIVFLDDSGFYVYEHNLKIGGKYGNFVTCMKDFEPCKVCESGERAPTYTAYYTIIDSRPYIRSDGTEVKEPRKVLFPAKGSAILMIDDLKKKLGSLVGVVVEVKRYSERGPNCGESFTKVGKINLVTKFSKYGKDMITPYDYMKVLAPPTEEELLALGIGAPPLIGSDEDVEDETLADLF